MQAHTQSTRAARDPLQAPRFPVAPTPTVSLSRAPVIPAGIVPAVTQSSAPAGSTSLANGIGLAHDAGNLLGALGLYCDLLSAPGVLRPEHLHYVTELRQIAARSDTLIHRLLAAPAAPPDVLHTGLSATAALQHDATQPAAPARNAAQVLREVEPLLAAIAGRAATLTCKAPRALPTPALSAEALERILVNLVRNAAQALELAAPRETAGHIRITLATLAGNLRLTVEDNGPGMPVTTAAAFLSPTPLPRGARHGLGHRIIHDLVTSSGGTLALRVRPGRGTTVTIQWPVPSNPSTSLKGLPLTAGCTGGEHRPGAITC